MGLSCKFQQKPFWDVSMHVLQTLSLQFYLVLHTESAVKLVLMQQAAWNRQAQIPHYWSSAVKPGVTTNVLRLQQVQHSMQHSMQHSAQHSTIQ